MPAGASKITYQDIKNIEALAAEPDVLEQLAASLAPSIYGHNIIKKGLLMLLLGGGRTSSLLSAGVGRRGGDAHGKEGGVTVAVYDVRHPGLGL